MEDDDAIVCVEWPTTNKNLTKLKKKFLVVEILAIAKDNERKIIIHEQTE